MLTPILPYPSDDDEPWHDIEFALPQNLPAAFTFYMLVDLPIHLLDRRLLAYDVRILVSDPTPEDPSDWPHFLFDWPGEPRREWRLWRLWLRYQHAPILGELRYEQGYGWMEVTYRPQWFARLATSDEVEKTARGLDLLLRRIPRPGHPPGGGTSFDSREIFEQKLRKALAIIRGRGRRLSKRAVALQMGIAPSTLDIYLARYPGIWEGA